MKLATLLLEAKMKLTSVALLLEHDVIERLEHERRDRLRGEIACLDTCADRQELLAALERCHESETDELCGLLDREFSRQHFDRRFSHLHLRSG